MGLWHSFILPITGYFRRRRVQLIRDACPELFDESPRTVLDLGGSRHFWANLPVDLRRKKVVIYNISHTETGGAQGPAAEIPVHLYDGHHLPMADGSVDVVICNSVIEHVPTSHRAALVAEMMRVGRRLILQAPAYEFPVEPHFIFPMLHWLPRPLGRLLVLASPWFWLSRPGVKHARDYFDEIHLPRRRDLQALFRPWQASIACETVGGLVKSYVVSAGPGPAKAGAPTAAASTPAAAGRVNAAG